MWEYVKRIVDLFSNGSWAGFYASVSTGTKTRNTVGLGHDLKYALDETQSRICVYGRGKQKGTELQADKFYREML
jgi:hypothetical protein